ncbi:MAG: teicoplanin resistance protein VanZ [Thermoleophilia bacterium]|nr:teicoplanin resistance protein VanZ [Thermoleophilia bacterium]
MALLGAWCLVIYVVSDQPGLRVTDDDLLDFVLRKVAHVGEYAVLAWLAWRVARRGGLEPTPAALAAWTFALAFAASDEWHQTFVAGRVGHPRDVLIDLVGASAALAVAWRHARTKNIDIDTQSTTTEDPQP